jgi:hypothetical protein
MSENALGRYMADAEEPGHTHPIAPDGSHQHTFQTSNEGNHQHTIGTTGGSNYHNNMQPTLFGGNMFIYSGKNVQAYFPYTWVGGVPAANGTPATPGNVAIF